MKQNVLEATRESCGVMDLLWAYYFYYSQAPHLCQVDRILFLVLHKPRARNIEIFQVRLKKTSVHFWMSSGRACTSFQAPKLILGLLLWRLLLCYYCHYYTLWSVQSQLRGLILHSNSPTMLSLSEGSPTGHADPWSRGTNQFLYLAIALLC